LWAGNAFSKADPKQAARFCARIGGGAALIFAGFLALRGEIGVAIPVGAFGLGLLGWVSLWPASLRRPHAEEHGPGLAGAFGVSRNGARSRQRRHAGRILAGRYEGAPLDALDVPTLIGLLGEVDDDSRDLLAAYLDRREPGWRENTQHDAAAGSGRGSPSGKMTEEEAYQILGLQPGASAEDIGRAHRSLMKKLHPDQGGSTYLAARVNEAKDVLLRRHR
jgi:hypothetical protein